MPKADFFKRFGIYVRESFLSSEQCDRMREEMISSELIEPAKVTNKGIDAVRTRSRSTRLVRVSEATRDEVKTLMQAQGPALARHFGVSLSSFEVPQYLLYREGDFFYPHTDSSNEPDAHEYIRDRKVSLVLFVNGHSEEPREGSFGGGELVLYNLIEGPAWVDKGFPLEPEKGLLIGFPSGMMHEVNPVTHGERCTIVAWYH